MFSGVKVGAFVGGKGVKVGVGIAVSVGTTLAVGAHEIKITTSQTMTMVLIFIDYLIMQGTAQRQVLAAGGGLGGKMPKGEPRFRG